MKKLLLILISLVLTFIVSILIFTNSNTLVSKALKKFGSSTLSEYGLKFEDLSFNYHSLSLTKKQITIDLSGRCFVIKNNKICPTKLEVIVLIDFLSPKDYLLEKLDFVLPAHKLNFQASEQAETESRIEIHDILNMAKSFFPRDKIRDLTLIVSDLILNSEHHADVRLVKSENKVQGHINYKKQTMSLHNKVEIDLSKSLNISSLSLFKLDKKPLTFKLGIKTDKKKMTLSLSDLLFKLDRNISVALKSCSNEIINNENIAFDCQDIQTIVKAPKEPLILNSNLTIWLSKSIDSNSSDKFLKIALWGKLKHKDIIDSQYKVFTTAYYNTNKKLEISIGALEFDAKINDFKKAMNFLKGTPYQIMAPFNSMEGSLEVGATLNILKDKYHIPFKGEINLDRSKDISFLSSLTGSIHLSKEFKIKELVADLVIENFKIYLPNIDPIKGIPEFLPPSDISKSLSEVKEVKDPANTFPYRITVKTKHSKSIAVYNKLLKPKLNFGFKARLNPGSVNYSVNIPKGTALSYLRREIQIDSLNLESFAKGKRAKIDAKLAYDRVGYTIFFEVIGTLESPKLILSSYPSLPREDIISVLIYGRKSDQLSRFNKESVGSTEAAITDRALGLFSIWAFASTPIDNISYDAKNKSYNASIIVPGEAVVEIGTDWDKVSSLSLRKRISETWALITTYKPEESGAKESVTLQKEISF